jgi:hypothetical protein
MIEEARRIALEKIEKILVSIAGDIAKKEEEFEDEIINVGEKSKPSNKKGNQQIINNQAQNQH